MYRPTFTITARDDTGALFGPVEVAWRAGPSGCGQVVALNSYDLERGNSEKGLDYGLGDGEGDWQLFVTPSEDACVNIPCDLPVVSTAAYVRTGDGLVAPIHGTVPFERNRNGYYIPTFNPGSNTAQRSLLRLSNPNDFEITVAIRGHPDNQVDVEDLGPKVPIAAHASLTISSQQLEAPNPEWSDGNWDGQLGDAYGVFERRGKWSLLLLPRNPDVASWELDGDGSYIRPRLIALNLMETPTGHLIGLSGSNTLRSRHVGDDDTTEVGEFSFQFVFQGTDFPPAVADSVRGAAARWERVIVSELPDIEILFMAAGFCYNDAVVNNVDVDDAIVFVKMAPLGSDGPVARANNCFTGPNYPTKTVRGAIRINSDRTNHWSATFTTQTFDKIMLHELGHVLGIYPPSAQPPAAAAREATGYFRTAPSPHFAGPLAVEAFWRVVPVYEGDVVPMDPAGSTHWHPETLAGELMAPVIYRTSALSEITVQALADLGYVVDLSEAEEYEPRSAIRGDGVLLHLDAAQVDREPASVGDVVVRQR